MIIYLGCDKWGGGLKEIQATQHLIRP